MPLISDMKQGKKKFKKKPYRPWDLLGESTTKAPAPETQTKTSQNRNVVKLRQAVAKTETKPAKTETKPAKTETKPAKTETKPETTSQGKRAAEQLATRNPVRGKTNSDKQVLETETSRVVLVSESHCLGLEQPLSQFEGPSVSVSDNVVSVTSNAKTETKNRGKLRQPRVLPTARQQLAILGYLLEQQESVGLNSTPRIKVKKIANDLQIPIVSVRKQLQRLVSSGLVQRISIKHGRGNSGCIYAVSLETRTAFNGIKLRQVTATNQDRQTKTTLRSSSNTTYTTTTDRHISGRLSNMIYELDLDRFHIDAGTLLGGWQGGGFSSLQDFFDSIEHLAFYLGTPASEGIKTPRAWVAAKLKSGYFPAPIGFESLEERRLKAEIQEKERKRASMSELQRKKLSVEFEIWEAELSMERRKELLADMAGVKGSAARAILRNSFLVEHGYSEDIFDG